MEQVGTTYDLTHILHTSVSRRTYELSFHLDRGCIYWPLPLGCSYHCLFSLSYSHFGCFDSPSHFIYQFLRNHPISVLAYGLLNRAGWLIFTQVFFNPLFAHIFEDLKDFSSFDVRNPHKLAQQARAILTRPFWQAHILKINLESLSKHLRTSNTHFSYYVMHPHSVVRWLHGVSYSSLSNFRNRWSIKREQIKKKCVSPRSG